jgi:hypothetical protein
MVIVRSVQKSDLLMLPEHFKHRFRVEVRFQQIFLKLNSESFQITITRARKEVSLKF